MMVGKMTVILKRGKNSDSVVPRLSGSLGMRLNVASSFLLFGHGNEARLNVTTGPD